jgi:AcrR family transcriptional regulator
MNAHRSGASSPRRSYTMRSRQEAVERTRIAILDATVALHFEVLAHTISLDLVAARAGTTVQTVLRHFGSREGLLEAASERGRRLLSEERAAPAGEPAEAVRVIVAHYERRGDGVMMLLAGESSSELVGRLTSIGRRAHRAWVEGVFGCLLSEARREESIDLLVVATDVFTWKLLRRDRKLSRALTERRMLALVCAVLNGGRSDG